MSSPSNANPFVVLHPHRNYVRELCCGLSAPVWWVASWKRSHRLATREFRSCNNFIMSMRRFVGFVIFCNWDCCWWYCICSYGSGCWCVWMITACTRSWDCIWRDCWIIAGQAIECNCNVQCLLFIINWLVVTQRLRIVEICVVGSAFDGDLIMPFH